MPDAGAAARSLLGVLAVAAIALLWDSGATAVWVAGAAAVAGAIALQDSPGGRITRVLVVSVEMGAAVFLGSLSLLLSLFGRTPSVGMTGSLVALLALWIGPPLAFSLLDVPAGDIAWGCNPFFATYSLNAFIWPDISGVNVERVFGAAGPAFPLFLTLGFLAVGSSLFIRGFLRLYDRRVGRA